MAKFRLPSDERIRIHTDVGSHEFPIFEVDENDQCVMTDRKENIYDKIQSYKDEVLLENIIKRCGLTGETLVAPPECFGDSRVLPKSLLEVKQNANKVQSFVDGLSDDDLETLNDKGFDQFLLDKINALKAQPEQKKEVTDNE